MVINRKCQQQQELSFTIEDSDILFTFLSQLRESITSHYLTGSIYNPWHYIRKGFSGFMIYKGAFRARIGENEQSMAYCCHMGCIQKLIYQDTPTDYFLFSKISQMSRPWLSSQLENTIYIVKIHVFKVDAPILLSIDGADHLEIL